MNNKKKVLILGSYPAPYRVGVFKGFYNEYDADVFFATCKNENRSKDWFCKSGEIEFSILDNEKAIADFNQKLKNIKKYDFVIAYDALSKFAMKAIFLCRLKGIPYFINCDGALLKKNFVKDLIKRFVYGGATKYFSSGKFASDYYRYYGAKDEDIVEHNFTSLNEEDMLSKPLTDKEKSKYKELLNISNKVTVLSIGQFIHRKGYDVLIDAWKKISDKANLIIVGGGDLRPQYEEYIKEHDIKGITIVDFLPKEELFKYYLASDLFVLPTREDIWGLVVNEAMANALPVITTDNCVAGLQLIEDGVNGYIVKVEDADKLGEKMLSLINDKELIKKMSENNLDKIRPWTISNVIKTQIAAINNAIS